MTHIQDALTVATGLTLIACQSLAQEGTPTMEKHRITNGNLSLQVYQDGPAEAVPLVFIHGDSGAAAQWFPVMSLLFGKYRTVAFDQRGHGASSASDEDAYGYTSRADDLRAIMMDGQYDRVVLIAHSGSAGMALDYSGQHGDTVAGILLLDPATDPRALPDDMRQGFRAAVRSNERLNAIQGYYASIAGQNPETVATVLADAAQAAPAAQIGVAEALLDWDPQTAIANWDGPMRMVITPPNDNPASLRHLAKNATYEVLSSEGHWPHLDDPTIIAQAIESFVDALE